MKKMILKRIANLREMINRMERPELVLKEMNSIFETIDKTEDAQTKNEALDALMDLTTELIQEVDESALEKILSVLRNKKTTVIPVNIKVHTYLDATLIKISRKVPYSNLIEILNKSTKNKFKESTKDIFAISYNKDDKNLHIDYLKEKHNEIIVDMSEWNMSDEVAEVYIEGLVEHIVRQ